MKRKTLLTPLLLILLILAGGIFMATTTTGLRWTYNLARQVIPGRLSIDSLQGTLASTLILKGVHYTQKQRDFTVGEVSLRWQPAGLLKNQITMTAITVRDLVATLPKATPGSSRFSVRKWLFPIKFSLDHLTLNHAAVHVGAGIIQGSMTLNHLKSGEIRDFRVANFGFGDWRLAKPTPILLGDQSLDLSAIQLVSGARRMTLQLQVQDEKNWSLRLMAPDLPVQGVKANVHFTLKQRRGKTTGHAQIIVQAGTVKLPSQTPKSYAIAGAKITASITDQATQAQVTLHAFAKQTLTGNFRLAGFTQWTQPLAKQTIRGEIQGNIPDLTNLSRLIPQLQNTQGTATANISVRGTLLKPLWQGALQIKNGSAEFPAYGLHLRQVNLAAHTDPQGILQFRGQLTSGKGALQFHGRTLWQSPTLETHVILSGENVEISRTTTARVIANPQLTLLYRDHSLHVDGQVTIPKATLTPRNLASTSVTSDIVYTDQQPKKSRLQTALPFQLYSQITLILGKDVTIDAQGLKSHLRGKLALTESPHRMTTARGEIVLTQGRYQIYGKELTIHTGRLLYHDNPVINPNLDVHASRSIAVIPQTQSGHLPTLDVTNNLNNPTQFSTGTATVTVGVKLTGNVKHPKITLYSEPAGMKSSDILSYLLFNQPTASASNAQGQLLYQAASFITPYGNHQQDLQQQIKKITGLDELTITTQPAFNPKTNELEQTTSLLLGKYLTPKLYVNYSIGLDQRASSLRLNYHLNDRLSIQSETNNNATGVDLLYSFESK